MRVLYLGLSLLARNPREGSSGERREAREESGVFPLVSSACHSLTSLTAEDFLRACTSFLLSRPPTLFCLVDFWRFSLKGPPARGPGPFDFWISGKRGWSPLFTQSLCTQMEHKVCCLQSLSVVIVLVLAFSSVGEKKARERQSRPSPSKSLPLSLFSNVTNTSFDCR